MKIDNERQREKYERSKEWKRKLEKIEQRIRERERERGGYKQRVKDIRKKIKK